MNPPDNIPNSLKEAAPVVNFIWFALFLALLFLFFRIDFQGPDFPIYATYINSLFEDGDLNLINNLPEAAGDGPCQEIYRNSEVSSTYNYPDFHNHGSVILWAPFYTYGKIAAAIHDRFSPDNPELSAEIEVCALSFSTVALSFFSCILLYLVAASFFTPRPAILATMLIFWGTPLFHYTLFETGNANLPALFMSLVLILGTPIALTGQRHLHALMLGLLYAICVTIKLDLWFQAILIGTSALYFQSQKRLKPGNLLFLATGFALGITPKFINDYLKYGDLHSGEGKLLNLHNSYHLQQMISPYQGFFSTSPLLLLALSGLLVVTVRYTAKSGRHSFLEDKDRAADWLLLAMTTWLIAKLSVTGFRFAWGGGTFGARQLLTELPLFTLLLALLFQWTRTLRRSWPCLLLATVSAALVFLNLLHASEYLAGEPIKYYVHLPSWSARLAHLATLMEYPQGGLAGIPAKLFCLPLLALLLWLGRALLAKGRTIQAILEPWTTPAVTPTQPAATPSHRWLLGLTVYLVVSYTAVTALNLANNRKNANLMTAAGCFEFARIVPKDRLEYQENYLSMEEMLAYYNEIGDQQEIDRILAVREMLYPQWSNTTPAR